VTDDAIAAAALDIADPAERAAYLDGACAGRPVLRHQVEQLLAVRTGAYEPPAEEPGASVGPYS
jgi:hypothetical protein